MVATLKSPELVTRERREVRKLGTLLEISRLLADTSNLKTAFAASLETLGRHHGMFRSFVMLLDRESEKIRIEASYGLVQSGKPVVVPQTSREPLLLNRLRSHEENTTRKEVSFICVPIMNGGKAVGVLGADRVYKEERDYDRTTKFLSVTAAMMAQALKVRERIEADKKRLLDENSQLKQELRTLSGTPIRCA
jgi:Nif-specific regulatory protein